MHIFMYACMHVCTMYMFMCIHAYSYIYTYIYLFIYLLCRTDYSPFKIWSFILWGWAGPSVAQDLLLEKLVGIAFRVWGLLVHKVVCFNRSAVTHHLPLHRVFCWTNPFIRQECVEIWCSVVWFAELSTLKELCPQMYAWS